MTWLKGLGAGILALIVGFVVVILVACIGIFGFGWFQRSTANYRGQTSAIEKTKANGDFRIAQYNAFFELCNGVKSTEGKIKIAVQTKEDFKGTDQETTAIANLAAIRSERINLINEYNAKAQAGFTSGQFRSRDLPYQIDPDQKVTQCA